MRALEQICMSTLETKRLKTSSVDLLSIICCMTQRREVDREQLIYCLPLLVTRRSLESTSRRRTYSEDRSCLEEWKECSQKKQLREDWSGLPYKPLRRRDQGCQEELMSIVASLRGCSRTTQAQDSSEINYSEGLEIRCI